MRSGPRGRVVSECVFRVLHVGNQAQASAVKHLALQCWSDLARRSLEQTHAQVRLQGFNGIRNGCPRQMKIGRRLGKAAALNDPRENPHCVESVHYSIIRIIIADFA